MIKTIIVYFKTIYLYKNMLCNIAFFVYFAVDILSKKVYIYYEF